MLVTSESLFFDEAKPELPHQTGFKSGRSFSRLKTGAFGTGVRSLTGEWRNAAQQHSLSTI